MFIFLFINQKELEESSIEKENDLIDDDLLWESYYSEIDQFEDN